MNGDVITGEQNTIGRIGIQTRGCRRPDALLSELLHPAEGQQLQTEMSGVRILPELL